MLKVRIIPVLLLKGSSLVKSVEFKDHRIVGDAVSAIKVFNQRFADEMIILDLDAAERGDINSPLLSRVSEFCNMPLSFGGGVDSLEKANLLFKSGADKIVVNSIFFHDKSVVESIIAKFGSQSVILSVDVKLKNNKFTVHYNNGKKTWDKGDLKDCLRLAEEVGVGEIMVNDISRDGVMNGFDPRLITDARQFTQKPLLIAGGCGRKEDFKAAFDLGVDAVCAGSVFHWIGESVISIKNYLDNQKINVRNI